MNKKNFILLFALSLFATSHAQQISVDDAATTAKKFWRASHGNEAKSNTTAVVPRLSYTASNPDGENYFYVFNHGDDNGFVIVGADQKAKTIIGYSDHGTFDYEKIPENMRKYLEEYENQIRFAIKSRTDDYQSEPQSRNPHDRSSIEQLLTTTWDQSKLNAKDEDNYNSLCPSIQGEKCLTGCVATAMAQIMNYHKHPAKGTGSHSYEWRGTTLSANFGATTYKWDKMLDNYDRKTTARSYNVALLMWHCGVSVNMDYDLARNGGSGASDSDVVFALTHYFDYDKALELQDRMYYTDKEWENLVYCELAEKRPVYYSGSSEDGGHAFVCDGYDAEEDKFHINWGWGGYCDGYYALTGYNALAPDDTGAGGGNDNSGYINRQSCITGIQPNIGNDYAVSFKGEGNLVASSKSIDRSQTLELSTDGQHPSFYNYSAETQSIYYGIKLVNKATQSIEYVSEDYPTSLDSFYGRSIIINASRIPEYGTYEVSPVFRLVQDDKWHDIDLPANKKKSVEVTLVNNYYLFVAEPLFFNDDMNVSREYMELHAIIKNDSPNEVNTKFFAFVFPGNKGSKWLLESQNEKFAPGEKKEIILTGSFPDIPTGEACIAGLGCYYEKFYDDTYYYFNIVADRKSYTLRMQNNELATLCLPYTVRIPNGLDAFYAKSIDSNNVIHLEKITGKIPRHTAVLLRKNHQSASSTFTFTEDACTELYSAVNLFKGVSGDTDLQYDGVYYQLDNSNGAGFYKKQSGIIPANSVYIDSSVYNRGADKLTFDFGENPNAINRIAEETEHNNVYYDLSGRKVSNPSRGIYILNRKKVYIK